MKNKHFLLSLTLLITLISSCRSTKSNFESNSIIFEKPITTDNVKADLIINDKNKISGVALATYFYFLKLMGMIHMLMELNIIQAQNYLLEISEFKTK